MIGRLTDQQPWKFTCAACSKTFTISWSDAEAEKEYFRRFEEFALAGSPRAVICHDCYLSRGFDKEI